MKKWLGVLLFAFSFSYGQNDSIKPVGVVAADRMNVVYRGVANPISIAVSNCKSFTANAPGLTKVSDGHYRLTPGTGLEVAVTLTITQYDDSVIIQKHTFRIKNIPNPVTLFNGRNCQDCIVEVQRKEFKNAAISIDTGIDFNINFIVEGFTINIPGETAILIDGNKFDNIYSKISKLKSGTEILISGARYGKNFDGYLKKAVPIRIKIIDDEIPFFQSKEFIRDSLQDIKNQRKPELKKKKK